MKRYSIWASKKGPDSEIIANISGADNRSDVEKLLSEEYAGLEIPSVKNIDGGIRFILRLPDKESDSIKKNGYGTGPGNHS